MRSKDLLKTKRNIIINSKWYISLLIVTLFVVGGLVSQDQSDAPNQEIVFQFKGATFTKAQEEQALAAVKLQLEDIGATNIQVNDQTSGELKITYYSQADVDHIKDRLSENEALALNTSAVASSSKKRPLKAPSKDKRVTYDLNVYEIQSGHDFSFEKSGKVAIELKAGNDRFYNPHESLSGATLEINDIAPQVQVAYKYYSRIAIAIDNRSKSIPEVRAGPVL